MDPPDFLKRMLDFNRVLDGENRQSKHPDDAEHWHAVYSELVGFKTGLLEATREEIERTPETAAELGAHDIPFLEAELQRLRGGLEFWSERLRDGSKSS